MKVREESTWLSSIKKHKYPFLKGNHEAEVVIIGGGITGIVSAYLLAQKRKKVILLEKDEVAGGGTVTAYTTAHLTQVIDTDYSEIIETMGRRKAKLIAKSHGEAIDLIERIVKKEKIDCEFKRVDAYKYANTTEDVATLREEEKALQVVGIDAEFAPDLELGFRQKGVLKIKNQAEFDAIMFISALAEICEKKGVLIFDKSEVSEIIELKDIIVKTSKGVVHAKYCITATYWPFHKRRDLFAKKGEYTSYVMEVELPSGAVPEGLYWDEESPYHYTRIDSYKGYDRAIIGGEDHRVEVKMDPDKNYNALEKYIKKIFPKTNYKITRKWNGPILEPIDGLAYIGKLTDSQLIGTAFSGNGMTYALISGMVFRDIITKEKNEYKNLYNPHRLPGIKTLLYKGKDYTEEFIGGAVKNLIQ